jgi:hypothetical protein
MIRLLLILLLLATPAYAEWDKAIPLAADNLTDFPTDNQANNSAVDLVLSNYRRGMKLTYSSATTIAVPAGEIVCSNAAGTVRKFRANTSSTNVTFADIDAGAEAGSTTYYVYANCDAVATTATFKISLSSTTPTGVTSYKRLGSFYNDSGSDITAIVNDDDNVLLGTGTVADAATVSVPSGFSADECDWTVATSTIGNASGGDGDNIEQIVTTINSSRLAACKVYTRNGVYVTGTCNYIISCHR